MAAPLRQGVLRLLGPAAAAAAAEADDSADADADAGEALAAGEAGGEE